MIWYSTISTGHNPTDMDLTPEEIKELESALQRLETLDPAELPEPAAELVELLNRLLEDTDEDI